MAFEGLTERLQNAIGKLRRKGKISESDVKEVMREIRLALLEADVNFKVVKDFVKTVRSRAIGAEVLESLTPAQQIVKIVNEELVKVMGEEAAPLNKSAKIPTIIMMVGLQGAGKTTTASKLANKLKKEKNARPFMIAADVYRPAAIDQLKILGKDIDVPVFSLGVDVDPVEIVRQGLEEAKDKKNDYVIIDTAGRLQIDEKLMQELSSIKELAQPDEILLTVDAMTGQNAVEVAKGFNDQLDVTGVVPQTVVVAFYVDAALLIITSLFTIFKVKEYDPETYALYHGISTEANEEKVSWIQLLKTAPKAFWTVTLVQFFCWFAFQYLWTYSAGAIAENVWHTTNATSQGYQAAGNWYGVLAAVQSIAAVVWSYVLAKVPNKYHKAGYFSSLLLGALGFLSIFFVFNQYVLIVSYILVGIAWAGINTYPLTIVTNALSGNHMGTYLGLFNGSICLPQIVASLLSFGLFPLLGGHQANMFLAAGIVLALGAFSVLLIKETYEA